MAVSKSLAAGLETARNIITGVIGEGGKVIAENTGKERHIMI